MSRLYGIINLIIRLKAERTHTNMAKIKVAVLFGGASKDHSASLQSAYWTLKSLPEEKYTPIPIGITQKGRWLYFPGSVENIITGEWENDADCCSAFISPDPMHGGIVKFIGNNEVAIQKTDVIISLIHGKYGECGRIQSLCKLSGIPYIGSKPDSAVACTDKMLTHLILDNSGFKTCNYFCLDRSSLPDIDSKLRMYLDRFGFPLYVKPASCTPSIGASKVYNIEELKAALKIAFSHHHKAIIEEEIVGRELECGVYQFGNECFATAVGEIVPDKCTDNLNFTERTSKIVIPAEISKNTEISIKMLALKAFQALACRSFAKINFTLSGDTIYCNKISNIPGLAPMNMFPMLINVTNGYSYADMLEMLITQAVENRV